MNLKPENDTVLCISESIEAHNDNGLYIPENDVFKTYLVIESSCAKYEKGDIIIANSTGTKVKIGNSVQYLFREENIIGKVID